MTERDNVRWLKYGVAVLMIAVNISVYAIWIPARLQISEQYILINGWWDRCEKVIYILVDGALNVYYILIVKRNLVSHGLIKYKRLATFNIFIIFFSLSMDVLIISMMSLDNTFVYVTSALLPTTSSCPLEDHANRTLHIQLYAISSLGIFGCKYLHYATYLLSREVVIMFRKNVFELRTRKSASASIRVSLKHGLLQWTATTCCCTTLLIPNSPTEVKHRDVIGGSHRQGSQKKRASPQHPNSHAR